MSTTAKTSEDFRRELEELLGGFPRVINQALTYASTLENNNSEEEEEEEEEEPIPTTGNRKKRVRPDPIKKGAFLADKAIAAVSNEEAEVKSVVQSLMNYIYELEK